MIEKNYAGLDGFVWWMGVVENRSDPLGLGRCQVRIYGWHTGSLSEIPREDLPWAQAVHSLNARSFAAPKESEVVFGFFADGRNAQYPIVVGVLPGYETNLQEIGSGFHDLRTETELQYSPKKPVSVEYPSDGSGAVITELKKADYEKIRYPLDEDLNKATTPRTARNQDLANSVIQRKRDNVDKDVETANEFVWSEPYPAFNPLYPFNQTFETESGHIFELDDTPKNERIALSHRSGTFIEMFPSGSKVEKVTKSNYQIIMADDHIHIMGRALVTVDSDCHVKILGDVMVEAGNDVSMKISGDFNLSVREAFNIKAKSISMDIDEGLNVLSALDNNLTAAGDTNILSTGNINIDGSKLNLNNAEADAASVENLKRAPSRSEKNDVAPVNEQEPLPWAIAAGTFDPATGYAYSKLNYNDKTEEDEYVEPGNTVPQVCNFDPNLKKFIESSSWGLSGTGIAIIAEFEGFRADAYVDPATGGEPITIGYGSTAVAIDKSVKLGDTVTKQEAEELLVYAINKKFLPSLKKYVKIPLTQEMVDACLSFIYNVGGGNFGSSTLVKKLNQKDYCGAGDEFLRWNKAAGKVLNGLTKRRNREKDLFLS